MRQRKLESFIRHKINKQYIALPSLLPFACVTENSLRPHTSANISLNIRSAFAISRLITNAPLETLPP